METDVNIRPAFQPIFSTLSGNVAFFESNLRIDGSVDKQFHIRLLAISEHLGFTHFIDLHMLKAACVTLRGHDIVLSTNVAQGSISAAFDNLVACVRDNPVSNRLIIEITESSWCSRELIAEFSRQVRAAGCQLAVDDFGQGFCDIPLVEAIRPDIIKIVLSEDEDDNRSRIEQAVQLAIEFDTRVVVERVDTVQKVRLAEEYKLDYMQGFILSEPMRLVDVDEAQKLTVAQALAPYLVENRPVEIIRLYDPRVGVDQAAIASR